MLLINSMKNNVKISLPSCCFLWIKSKEENAKENQTVPLYNITNNSLVQQFPNYVSWTSLGAQIITRGP